MKRIMIFFLYLRDKGKVVPSAGLLIGWFILTIIGMNACRSHKKTTTDPVGETAYYSSCYPIESLSVPSCKLEISNDGKTYSLNGSIYIRPDSICYFRGKLIVEAMRGVIYRDSFVVVSYLDRTCYKGKNDYLQRITGYPVNPESLLMLFTADRCEEKYRDRFNFVVAAGSSDKILMQGKNRSLLEMNINENNHTIDNIALYNNGQRNASFSTAYSGYTRYASFVLPTIFDISAYDSKKNIGIKAGFQQIIFNEPQKVHISIPSNYKVINLQ